MVRHLSFLFNLNIRKQTMPQHQLYGLQGNAYAAKYKQLYEDLKGVIEEDVSRTKIETGKFSLKDFGALCMKHRIPASAMDDFLNSLFPLSWTSGTWERAGVKAKDIGIIWSDD